MWDDTINKSEDTNLSILEEDAYKVIYQEKSDFDLEKREPAWFSNRRRRRWLQRRRRRRQSQARRRNSRSSKNYLHLVFH